MHSSVDAAERSRFLRVAAISIFVTILLSRLLHILRASIYYNTAISDGVYNLVYYLCQAMYAAALSVGFAMIVCAFFLYNGKATGKTVLFSVIGTAIFHLSAFFVDLINGFAESPLSLLGYCLIQILIQILIETFVLLIVLWTVGRKNRTATPVRSLFSVKSKPQLSILVFSLIFFAECFIPDMVDVVLFLIESDFSIYVSEFLEILMIGFEDILLFFAIPYGTMTLLYSLFANRKSENSCV